MKSLTCNPFMARYTPATCAKWEDLSRVVDTIPIPDQMKRAPLNVFQKTQRLWDKVHPYNAAQAAVLAEAQPFERIEHAFNQAMIDMHLGMFICSGGAYHIDRSGRLKVPVKQVTDFQAHISGEMNDPFESEKSMPFRPFVCNDENGQTIGVTYQHWVADSVSIRTLMRGWISRLLDVPSIRPEPVVLDCCGLRRRFGPDTGNWSVVTQITDFAQFAKQTRTLRRIEPKVYDQDVATTMRMLPDGLIGKLKHASRKHAVTIGDIFMASAAEAIAKHGPNRPTRRRPDLALGTIVDLRARNQKVSTRVFGLYLGFMISAFPHDDLYDFDHLLHRSKNLRLIQNKHRSAEASQLRIALGLLFSRALNQPKLIEFYRKRFPLSGGLSNVNLTQDWPGILGPKYIRAYHRISPTGPLMPIVLTPTTLGDKLSLCCTYRVALASKERVSQLIEAFTNRLIQVSDM